MTDGDASLDAEIEKLAQHGRGRMTRYYVGAAVVVPVLTVSAALIAGSGAHVHHHNLAAIVAGVVVGGLLTIAVLWLGRRRWSTAQHVVVMAGLDRRRRRQVMRDIRRGTPSDDPVLREIEKQQSLAMQRQARYGVWLFPALAVLEIVNAILRDSVGARVFHLLAAALMIAVWGLQLAYVRRARIFPA